MSSSSAPGAAFTLWIDADGAPAAVKEIVFKASTRLQVPVVVVANAWQQTPRTPRIRMVQVEHGLDVADEYIVQHLQEGDVVISSDVPLAAEAVARGAVVVDFRGELLDKDNVRQRLSVRDFMEELRAGGVMGGGPPPYDARARQAFANALDRLLTRKLREG